MKNIPPAKNLHVQYGFLGRPKDVQDCSDVPEEFLQPLFFSLFLSRGSCFGDQCFCHRACFAFIDVVRPRLVFLVSCTECVCVVGWAHPTKQRKENKGSERVGFALWGMCRHV